MSLVSFILTQNLCLVEVDERELRLDSSVGTGPTTGHGSASRIVIMVQSVVILSLSFWFVEEYLNNKYLGEYLNGVFQADGLVIGMLGTLLVLGSVSSLMLMKRRHGEKRFEAVSLEVTPAAPKIKGAVVTSAKPFEASPNMDFHPVVAALKADMADRRMSFGSVLGAGTQQPTTGPAPSVEAPKTSVLDQLTPNRQAPMTSSRTGQTAQPFPQHSLHDLRPQPLTGPRVEQPGASLGQQYPPVPRPQEPVGSNVLQPSQATIPKTPTNVTTVITGIMPAQKKKEDPATNTEQKSSP
ncbi:MAG TPA: hypothetical protein VEL71_02205 [Candidatus Dormibacteraeota bacterium]|nr:hypothetical protein [Candidatus Dormibacteraeota bacterium]